MRFTLFLLFLATLTSCTRSGSELSVGPWRGIITVQGQELPFNFDVSRDSGRYKVYLKNGDERLMLDEISTADDSVRMVLHIFDAELRAKVAGNKLSGYFIRNYAPDYKFPFTATYGENYRFVREGPSVPDYTGKYDVRFFAGTDTIPSVAIFSQKGNHVTGTFLLNDGDYRYLEGNVVDGNLRLSTFDGNHAYVFTASAGNDKLTGDFYAGKSTHQTWVAVRNDHATMPDPDALAGLKPGFEKIEFRFPDVDKKWISLSDEKYRNKVVIVQILGTWCPNCMDETRFLVPWYNKNKDRGVEILGLAYERKDDFEYASKRVRIMKKKMGMEYDVVIAGVNDNKKVLATLPALRNFIGFPTTIFVGRDGKVKKIHSGFTGPGTGVYYDEFIQYFNATVDDLLKAQDVKGKP